MRSLPALLALLAAAPTLAAPQSYIVFPDGTGQYPTIQAAVDAASDGTEILLADGTFRGAGNAVVDFKGKAITIRSLSGNRSACVIEGDWLERDCAAGVVFNTDEGPFSVLADLTIRHGGGWSSYGCWPGGERGAITCRGASPTIRNVECIEGNGGIHIADGAAPRLENVRVAASYSPGVAVDASSPVLVGCIIESNSSPASWGGGTGGVTLSQSAAILERCRIEGNGGSPWNGVGGVQVSGGSPTLRECVLVNNAGVSVGAVSVTNLASPRLERCTISRCSGGTGGVRVAAGSTAELDRTILWGNCGTSWDEAGLDAGALLTATCSDVRAGGVGGGGTFLPDPDTLDNAPMFCGPHPCGLNTGGWYAVDAQSEVITAACGPIGALASECDIGVEPVTWGRLKALYR